MQRNTSAIEQGDRVGSVRLRHIGQGEMAIGSDRSDVFTTVLGSCVAVCLWDPVLKQGGMNHILLPTRSDQRSSESFAACDMERLVNGLMKEGSVKSRLQAKVFGGAKVVEGLSSIGDANTEFVNKFLLDEGIACVASSTGGTSARMIRFLPHSGAAFQRIADNVAPPVAEPSLAAEGNDVELFG